MTPDFFETGVIVKSSRSGGLNVGHLLKTAWALSNVYRLEPNPAYKAGAERLINEVLDYDLSGNKAYDHVNGGPFGIFKWDTGLRNDAFKQWWGQEQAVASGLTAWFNSGNEDFLAMADQTLQFYTQNYIDSVYGEVFHSAAADGTPNDTRKGHANKGSYHSVELGYYAYLYGKLFVHRKPATLYYKLDAKASNYDVTLTPLPMAEGCLTIEDVEIDGEEYDDDNFDEETRTITMAAGVGGIVKVQFELDDDCDQDFDD